MPSKLPTSHHPFHISHRQGPTASPDKVEASLVSGPRGERVSPARGEADHTFLISHFPSPITGFTLIELLVAIAIVGILSTVGIVVYQGATKAANSAKVKGDLDAIRKAYESKYDAETNTYLQLQGSDFAQGVVPSPPAGGSYFVTGPNASPSTSFFYSLSADTQTGYGGGCTGPNCQTITSTQGSQVTGPGGIPAPSCDPTGALYNGLVGWWKFDSNTNDSAGTNNGNFNGGTPFYQAGKNAALGMALDFDSINDYVNIPSSPNLQLGGDMTYLRGFELLHPISALF